MPIIIPKELPAYKTLNKENIFIVDEKKAKRQDVRELKIIIVNLMPDKIQTETQLIRMLSNTPMQIKLDLLNMDTHKSKTTDDLHLKTFYKKLKDIKTNYYDGMIITGAPVETLPFEKVDYYSELKELMKFSKTNVFSTLHLCWGAQAGLYYHFGIKKLKLKEKLFGVFNHKVINQSSLLTMGLDKFLCLPHSRWTGFHDEDIENNKDLSVLIKSKEAGIHLIYAHHGRQIFSQGHWEYDIDTLKKEYERDKKKGLIINIPKHYFKDDNPKSKIIANWKGNGTLFFLNWINFVYQKTPFDLEKLKAIK